MWEFIVLVLLSNAQVRRSSESLVRENFMHGLIRGRRAKAHCPTLPFLMWGRHVKTNNKRLLSQNPITRYTL